MTAQIQLKNLMVVQRTEVYTEPRKTSKMKRFTKLVNEF